MQKPNVVFILADQLRAASLPFYGEKAIATPHLDRLFAEGINCTNAISSAPICTPYRAMLVTGRHPHTTGHIGNFICTRHDEIGIGDAFTAAGYRTAWVGKWHLQAAGWPAGGMRQGAENGGYIPDGRPRLGFQHWRAYNMHETYFDGWVDKDNWRNERWQGYETQALNRYGFAFMDAVGDDAPFCLFLSPHQPHMTCVGPHAPEQYYAKLPARLELPPNVTEDRREACLKAYRDYLAMTLAIDDMVGEVMDYLRRTGKDKNTILVFTSDHGSQFGAHGHDAWSKALPYEESIHVPLAIRLPDAGGAGTRSDAIVTPVDLFPTLCGFCNIPVPRSVEGMDLSAKLLGQPGAPERDDAFIMNFCDHFCFFDLTADPPGAGIWRGVRTRQFSYCRWYSGKTELHDIVQDPLQQQNLSGQAAFAETEAILTQRLDHLLRMHHDPFGLAPEYQSWFDTYRRVVRNAYGELPPPDGNPDFSLLDQA